MSNPTHASLPFQQIYEGAASSFGACHLYSFGARMNTWSEFFADMHGRLIRVGATAKQITSFAEVINGAIGSATQTELTQDERAALRDALTAAFDGVSWPMSPSLHPRAPFSAKRSLSKFPHLNDPSDFHPRARRRMPATPAPREGLPYPLPCPGQRPPRTDPCSRFRCGRRRRAHKRGSGRRSMITLFLRPYYQPAPSYPAFVQPSRWPSTARAMSQALCPTSQSLYAVVWLNGFA